LQAPERDEILSWRAAATIMVIATILTVTTRLLGLDPFTDVFDIFIVYLPTLILVGIMGFEKLRGFSAQSGHTMGDQRLRENTAA
jgi:hypothetical protein